jgi:hypothetical protein
MNAEDRTDSGPAPAETLALLVAALTRTVASVARVADSLRAGGDLAALQAELAGLTAEAARLEPIRDAAWLRRYDRQLFGGAGPAGPQCTPDPES